MNRVAIFAHYDSHNEIQEYVINYIKELNKLAKNIIFVSDSNLPNSELEKISKYTVHAIAKQHGEYDFGSYKRGFIYADENNLLTDCEELIFANDSCYAPLFSFDDMFKKMANSKADFWGPTLNMHNPTKMEYHVQSFFIVFRSQIFNNDEFKNFIHSISKQENKNKIIEKYEIGLSVFLQNIGFSCDSYSSISKKYPNTHVTKYKDIIIKERTPFLKRNIVLKKELENAYPSFIKHLINKTNYDYNLIKQDISKNKININLSYKIKCLFKYYKKRILKFSYKNKTILLFNTYIIKW